MTKLHTNQPRFDFLTHHHSPIKLFQLVHCQELDLVINQSGESIASVSGAFDLIRWDELSLAQRTVQAAVVRADIFTEAEFRTDLSIVRQTNGKWNPIYTLWLDSPEVDEDELGRAQSVGLEVLRALGLNPNNPTPALCFDELTEGDRVAVLAVAEETLMKSGGHALKKPMSVLVDDKIELTLCGRLGAKPGRANYAPTPEVLTGTFRGFVNDHKQRALLFGLNDSTNVEIGFVELQLESGVLNLTHIVALNLSQAQCHVETIKTTDSIGKTVYEFVSISPGVSGFLCARRFRY